MSSLLSVGAKASLSKLKGEWMKQNKAHRVQVSHNHYKPTASYFSICYNAPKGVKTWRPTMEAGRCCPAHLMAKGETRDEMEITSIDLNHTCAGDPSSKDPKRNYNTKDLMCVSEAIEACQPTRAKEGNAQQLIDITKSAIGFTMKKGQAAARVRSLGHDTIAAQIGQYMFLPSLIEAFKEVDPDGACKLDHCMCSWDRAKKQFKRCHIRPSVAGHFWKHAGMDMFTCDGTFTKLKAFRHIILVAAAFDGDGQVIILAIAVVEVEDSDNWVFFKENLEDDFPGAKVWMSDADKGIESNRFTASLSQSSLAGSHMEESRCVKHMAENCKEANGGTTSEEQRDEIISLAKARTATTYHVMLGGIRNQNNGWADWLDFRRCEFATHPFLGEKGIRRCGKVTSGGVENINGALRPERALPIMHVMQAIVDYQRNKYCERKEQARTWVNDGKALTFHAEEEDKEIVDGASKRTVDCFVDTHPIYKANVSVGSTWSRASVQVTADVVNCTAKCPCLHKEEFGCGCEHVKALLLKLGRLGVGKEWYDRRYHTTTYNDSYSADTPSMSVVGRLKHDPTFLPPDHRRGPGRPKKKRRGRPELRKTNVQRRCKACNGTGHFTSDCPNPTTQHRVANLKDDIVAHCERVEMECNNLEG